MKKSRNENGTFSRRNQLWSPENWDLGYMDKDGRFRVYRPDCPRSYSNGYALRAHVVWWLEHGKPHPANSDLHHKDGVKHNDHIENLELLTRSTHRKVHQENWLYFICDHCKKEFKEHAWRTKSRVIRFCSQDCYHAHPRDMKHKNSISNGLKKAYKEGRR